MVFCHIYVLMLTSWLLLFIFWKTNLTSSLAFHFLSIGYRNGHDWTLAHLSSIFSSKLPACFFMFSLLAASLFYCLPRLSSLIHFPLLFLTGQFLLIFRNRCFRKLSLTPRPLLSSSIFPLCFQSTWWESLVLPVSLHSDLFVYIIHLSFGTTLSFLRLGTIWLTVPWSVGDVQIVWGFFVVVCLFVCF